MLKTTCKALKLTTLTVGFGAEAMAAYLLRNVVIDRPNQVWCADITYIPMRRGFLYLVAIMDWFSRKVLAWRLSNSMDGKGAWRDNRMIERLWRSLKYECVYLRAFETGSEMRTGISKWLTYYNAERPHSTHTQPCITHVDLPKDGIIKEVPDLRIVPEKRSQSLLMS